MAALIFREFEIVNTILLSDAPPFEVAVNPVAPVIEGVPAPAFATGTVKVAEFSPAVVPISTIVFVAYSFSVRALPPQP